MKIAMTLVADRLWRALRGKIQTHYESTADIEQLP